MREQTWMALLGLRSAASAASTDALVTYYTGSSYHLGCLEADVETLDRAIAGLRLALQAARSRGEDPLSDIPACP